eukprot:9938638-Prorocentrum_lima.AAC.1
MARHGVRAGVETLRCLVLPSPVGELVARNAWRDLILLGRWYHKERRDEKRKPPGILHIV